MAQSKQVDIKAISLPFRDARRNHAQISKQFLAEVLNIPPQKISRFENGRDVLPGDTLTLIFNAGIKTIILACAYADKQRSAAAQ